MSRRASYRAIFLDLDGTLLPMDLDDFMSGYFRSLGTYMAKLGVNPERFMSAMKAGIASMVGNKGERLNHDAFWESFLTVAGSISGSVADESWDALVADFYENEFGKLCTEDVSDPAAARVVDTLAAKGYPMLLTTMPMFPERAVRWRLQWAGLDPDSFSRITSYRNSMSVKPRLIYYGENLLAAGVSGHDVLMVGNNTVEDLSSTKLGIDAFLVTDNLIDPVGFDLNSVRHGSLADLAAWVEELPDCADPATDVSNGQINSELTARAVEENLVEGRSDYEDSEGFFQLYGM